jgi:hypothetical protein
LTGRWPRRLNRLPQKVTLINERTPYRRADFPFEAGSDRENTKNKGKVRHCVSTTVWHGHCQKAKYRIAIESEPSKLERAIPSSVTQSQDEWPCGARM